MLRSLTKSGLEQLTDGNIWNRVVFDNPFSNVIAYSLHFKSISLLL